MTKAYLNFATPFFIFIDLFCGAGGVTNGLENATVNGHKVAVVACCVNHDVNAIKSHQANHPQALHFTEDIRTLDMTPIIAVVRYYKKKYPNAKVCLWASLECTNFSRAKGGMARDADSRTLAEHLIRYIEAVPYDYIFIENVEEFMTWGPMRIKPKREVDTEKDGWFTELTIIKDKKTGEDKYGWEPIPEYKGMFYDQWISEICSYGFNYDYRIMCMADYGCDTYRERYFGAFAKHGLPMVWPQQTHDEKGRNGLQPWKPVRNILDINDDGESMIFGRKKDLSDNTLERVYNGLKKHVKNAQKGKNTFIEYMYGNGYTTDLNVPAGTLRTKECLYKIDFIYIHQYGGQWSHVDRPAPTLLASGEKTYTYKMAVEATAERVEVEFLERDTQMMRKLKTFMMEHGIADVKRRPLSVTEQKRITGLPDNYVLCGTKADQIKYIGNAVPSPMAQKLIESFAQGLLEMAPAEEVFA